MTGTRRPRSMRRWWLLLIVVSALAPGAMAHAAYPVSEAYTLLALTNDARLSVGLEPVIIDDNVSAFAQEWAEAMADWGAVSHNPDLGTLASRWADWAENVGMGSTVDVVHDTLLLSRSHYQNIVNPSFDRIGIGVAYRGGTVFVVENFVQTGASSSGAVRESSASPAPDRPPQTSPAAGATLERPAEGSPATVTAATASQAQPPVTPAPSEATSPTAATAPPAVSAPTPPPVRLAVMLEVLRFLDRPSPTTPGR